MQGIERSNQRVCNFSAQYVIPVFVIMETRQTRQSVNICEKLLTHFTRVHGTVLSTKKQEYRQYLLNVWIFIRAVANACSKCTTSVPKCRTGAKCRNCAKRMALLAVHSPYVQSEGKSFKRLQARKRTVSTRYGSISVRGKRLLVMGILRSGNKIEAFIYILKARIRVSKKKARKIKVITLILSYLCVQTCFSECEEPSLNNTVRKKLIVLIAKSKNCCRNNKRNVSSKIDLFHPLSFTNFDSFTDCQASFWLKNLLRAD